MPVTVEPLLARDWSAVERIYREGIATGQATFEMQSPGWTLWDERHLPEPRLLARDEAGTIVGWAALSAVSARPVYRGVAEVSVYVAAAARGHGVGRALLDALVVAATEAGIWTLQAGIFPENAASLRLHAACGFRVVGTRERLGQLRGVWRDVLLLERRRPGD